MNLLITGAWKPEEETISQIRALGHEVYFMPQEAGILPCDPGLIHAVICNGLFLHYSLSLFSHLRFIQLTSAGYDRVPLDEVRERGIQIFNARGIYDIPMAEFALTGVLELYKQSRFFIKNQSQQQWIKHRGLLELEGKTVCVIGCGSVGSKCAIKFSAMDCRVIGVDAYPIENPVFEKIYSLDLMNDALGISDIVVLCVPLLPETRNLIDATAFESMKQGTVLVNISRGAVVDSSALISALESKLFGAVLDVFDKEPLGEDSPLWDLENVILTPHNSFVGENNGKRLERLILSNLENQV